jgi:tellurite resistance protein TehA-like permease
MATGITSIALAADGARIASLVLLGVTAFVWAALTATLIARLVHDRERLTREARLPASLTGVAGSCVLATRLAMEGRERIASALLIAAALAWLPLLAQVLRSWRRPTWGGSFLVAVSAEAIATAFATLGSPREAWLALAVCVAGVVLYAFVVASFDLRQVVDGAGDQWVAGGAVAISALAAAKLAGTVDGLQRPLADAALCLWIFAMAWLPVLAAGEVVRPRLRFDVRRWATVFPLGMYAVMSFAVAGATGHAWIEDFARAWTVVAVAAWAAVALAATARAAQLLRRTASA